MTPQITNGQKYCDFNDKLSHKLAFRMRFGIKKKFYVKPYRCARKWVDKSTKVKITRQKAGGFENTRFVFQVTSCPKIERSLQRQRIILALELIFSPRRNSEECSVSNVCERKMNEH